jgi:hypothetical protein
MRKILLFISLILFISGCATPFASQYQQLNEAYKSGQLSYKDYVQAYQNLQAQEMQWRYNMNQAIMQFNQQVQENQRYEQAREDYYRTLPFMIQSQQRQQPQQPIIKLPTQSHTRCWQDAAGNINCDTTSY